MVQLVGAIHGSTAAKIMEHLAILGYATADELEAQLCEDNGQPASETLATLTNGHRDNSVQFTDDHIKNFRSALKHLIDNKFVLSIRDAHFQSLFDARQEVERHFQHLGVLPSAKGKKMQSDMDHRVDIELESRLDGTISSASVLQNLDQRGSNNEDTSHNQVSIFR